MPEQRRRVSEKKLAQEQAPEAPHAPHRAGDRSHFGSRRATRRTLRHSRLQVGVELKAVAVRIAHVELTRAPAGVSDIGAVDKHRVLLR
jgi:hypothetical protein